MRVHVLTEAANRVALLAEGTRRIPKVGVARDHTDECLKEMRLSFHCRDRRDQGAVEGEQLTRQRWINDHRRAEEWLRLPLSRQFGSGELHEPHRRIERAIGKSLRRRRFTRVRLIGMHREDAARRRLVLLAPRRERLRASLNDANRVIRVNMPGEGMRDERGMEKLDAEDLRAGAEACPFAVRFRDQSLPRSMRGSRPMSRA